MDELSPDPAGRPPPDPRDLPELIEVALGSDDNEAWDVIAALHWRGTSEVLQSALGLCARPEPGVRARGADILGQLGIPHRTFPEECFVALQALLSDPNAGVLSSAIVALSHLDAERAMPHILGFTKHRDDDVRFSVTTALGGLDAQEAIEALIELSSDKDSDVRDWATFGLGSQTDVDSQEIRAALAAALHDDDPDVRYEAVCGLGRRGDARSIPFLKNMLHDQPKDIFLRGTALMLLGLDERDEMSSGELLGALQRRQRWMSGHGTTKS